MKTPGLKGHEAVVVAADYSPETGDMAVYMGSDSSLKTLKYDPTLASMAISPLMTKAESLVASSMASGSIGFVSPHDQFEGIYQRLMRLEELVMPKPKKAPLSGRDSDYIVLDEEDELERLEEEVKALTTKNYNLEASVRRSEEIIKGLQNELADALKEAAEARRMSKDPWEKYREHMEKAKWPSPHEKHKWTVEKEHWLKDILPGASQDECMKVDELVKLTERREADEKVPF